METISAKTLKQRLHGSDEIALLDVREFGQYGEDHLFYAVSIPYSLLEAKITTLVPRLSTPIVLYAHAHQMDLLSAATQQLHTLTYDHVVVLEGGIEAWKQAGFNTFAGVNVPSKTFGELVEHHYQTPSISANTLKQWLEEEPENVQVLDGRPYEEYQKMTIPSAANCPNGELALRATSMAKNKRIVVNCAGRTRSILGAQSLINLGVKQEVYALENGTQGWYLNDYALKHGANQAYPQEITLEEQVFLRQKAQHLQQEAQIKSLTDTQCQAFLNEAERTSYFFDTRTPEEYQAQNWPSLVRHAPGGQLIQATDEYIGTRHARIILLDMDGIRAPVIAAWLKQLGWECYLLHFKQELMPLLANLSQLKQAYYYLYDNTSLHPLLTGLIDKDPEARDANEWFHALTINQLKEEIKNVSTTVYDARQSILFKKQHLQKATWLNRSHLLNATFKKELAKTIVLIDDNWERLQLLAFSLHQLGAQAVHYYLIQTEDQWLNDEEFDWVKDDPKPMAEECIDFLFFVHDRHSGNKEASRQYLAWELGLIDQLDEQELKNYDFN